MALIPEAVAFALIAGLSPLTGLYAAFVVGLMASVLGGRPGMISGATGAVTVVIAALNRLTSCYQEAGKKVHLRHLSEDCRRLMDKADDIIEVNMFEDPTYKVLTDQT